MTPFTQWGGLQVGDAYSYVFNAKYPFAKIIVDQQGIQINALSFFFVRRYRFARTDIRRLGTEYGVPSRGLVIEHTRYQHPAFMMFWSVAWSELSAAMQQCGYRVYDDW